MRECYDTTDVMPPGCRVLFGSMLCLSMLLALLADPATAPTIRPLDARVESAIIYCLLPATNQHWVNRQETRDRWIEQLNACDPIKLQDPLLLPAMYIPAGVEGAGRVEFAWLQDKPTLREVTLRHPVSGKVHVIRLSEADLRLREEWSERTVLFIYIVKDVPLDIIGDDPRQALELKLADGQRVDVQPSYRDR